MIAASAPASSMVCVPVAAAPRRGLTCQELYQRQVAGGTITLAQYARKREKLELQACSSTWAADAWDSDPLRKPRSFWGLSKRRCERCRRETPPQDLAFHRRTAADGSIEFHTPRCTDCRTRAHSPPTPLGSRAEAARFTAIGESANDIDETIVPESPSPSAAAIAAVAAGHASFEEIKLEPEDEPALRAQIARYQAAFPMVPIVV